MMEEGYRLGRVAITLVACALLGTLITVLVAFCCASLFGYATVYWGDAKAALYGYYHSDSNGDAYAVVLLERAGASEFLTWKVDTINRRVMLPSRFVELQRSQLPSWRRTDIEGHLHELWSIRSR
jgi:hypothetical protein